MTILRAIAILCAALLIAQNPYTFAQPAQAGAPAGQPQNVLAPQQLESLVAPVALYPDPILSQMLVASTYPMQVVEAGQWLSQHANLQGQARVDAARQQPWDASVQALVMLPDVLNRLNQDVSWTSNLGNAFLTQQAGVMDAIQRLRQQAAAAGVLKSTPQQTVSTTTANGQTYIVIEPASPEMVSIPQYNPAAVWGPAPAYYPYPSMYYPSVATGALIGFGAGIAVGAFWGGGWGGWGWNPGWGRNTVIVNRTFINNNHFNRVNVGNGNAWIHNPANRAGIPTNNRGVANRFQGGGANMPARPTVGQTQQMLHGQGMGSANRMAPGNSALRGGQSSIGSANRMSPGSPGRPGGGLGNRGLSGGGSGAFGGANHGFGGGGFGNRNFGGGGHAFGGGNRAQVGGGFGGFHRGGGGIRGGGGGGRGRR